MKPDFYATFPSLEMSGVLSFTINLFNELTTRGYGCEIILTGHKEEIQYRRKQFHNFHISSIGPTGVMNIKERFRKTAELMGKSLSPILLPGYDFDFFYFTPWAKPNLKTFTVLHSDEEIYYKKCIEAWENNTFFLPITEIISDSVSGRIPSHFDKHKIRLIPVGVPIPRSAPRKAPVSAESPLFVVYSGRISKYQKRIMDLAKVINYSSQAQLNIQYHIAGSGPDEQEFLKQIAIPIEEGNVVFHGSLGRSEIEGIYKMAHCILMTSQFEGLPISLMEAMAFGCIPVTSNIKSGIPDLVKHELNGFIFNIGDVEEAVHILKRLSLQQNLQELSSKSFESITLSPFSINNVADAYLELATEEPLPSSPQMEGLTCQLPPQYTFSSRIKKTMNRVFKRS
jgi:glycosyltransferase involved in cell wall biosynthesis